MIVVEFINIQSQNKMFAFAVCNVVYLHSTKFLLLLFDCYAGFEFTKVKTCKT